MHRLRIFWIIFRGLFHTQERNSWEAPLHQSFRIYPWDVELTRAFPQIYSSLMAISRWAFCSYRIGIVKLFKSRWIPLTYSEHTVYKRALKVFSRVDVETRLFHVSDKMIFFRHLFYSGSQLSAIGYSCGNLYKDKNFIPLTDIFGPIPEALKIPTKEVEYWQKLDQEAKQFSRN